MLKRGGVARFALFVGLTLEGCGDSSSSRHSATGGAVGSASGGAVGFGGASATAGAGGQAGTTIVEPVPSIAGDWALIGFEDPVAVQLSQGDGVLEGVGCIAGLPRPQVTDPLFRDTWIYVSKGTGYWGPPMRVGTGAELTHIELIAGPDAGTIVG